MPANIVIYVMNASKPENGFMPMFLTSSETEMHIWKYDCE